MSYEQSYLTSAYYWLKYYLLELVQWSIFVVFLVPSFFCFWKTNWHNTLYMMTIEAQIKIFPILSYSNNDITYYLGTYVYFHMHCTQTRAFKYFLVKKIKLSYFNFSFQNISVKNAPVSNSKEYPGHCVVRIHILLIRQKNSTHIMCYLIFYRIYSKCWISFRPSYLLFSAK